MYDKILTYSSAIAGGLIGFLFGQVSDVFYVLIALVVLDFITGIMSAYVEKEINSKICFEGIIKKVFIFIMVALGHLTDTALNLTIVMNTVMFFYIANEGISIIENAAKCGVPFPKKMTELFAQLKQSNDEETNND